MLLHSLCSVKYTVTKFVCFICHVKIICHHLYLEAACKHIVLGIWLIPFALFLLNFCFLTTCQKYWAFLWISEGKYNINMYVIEIQFIPCTWFLLWITIFDGLHNSVYKINYSFTYVHICATRFFIQLFGSLIMEFIMCTFWLFVTTEYSVFKLYTYELKVSQKTMAIRLQTMIFFLAIELWIHKNEDCI